jgi:hypothetical protein
MYFQPSWPKHCLIDEVLAVSNPNYKYIVETIDTVNASKKLIDDRVGYPVVRVHTTFFADGINFIEDDAV